MSPAAKMRDGFGESRRLPKRYPPVERIAADQLARPGEHRRGQRRRIEVELGDLDPAIEKGVGPPAILLPAARTGAVPHDDPEIVRPGDHRNHAPEQERAGERRRLVLGRREERLRPVGVEDPLRVLPRGDLDRGDEHRPVAADARIARHDHRGRRNLDRPVQVVAAGPRQQVVEPGASHMVEEVVAFDGAQLESLGVAGVEAEGRRPVDFV